MTPVGNREWGGYRKGVFAIVDQLRFLCEEIYYCKGIQFLLKIDTSLAIATSGLRTNLLLQERRTPPPKTPHSIFPNLVRYLCETRIEGTSRKVRERHGIAQKGVRAIDPRKTAARIGENAAKTNVRPPGLSAD